MFTFDWTKKFSSADNGKDVTGSQLGQMQDDIETNVNNALGYKDPLVIDNDTNISIAQLKNGLIIVDTSSGNVTVTLPSVDSSNDGLTGMFKIVGSNTATFTPSDSDTVDGSASYSASAGTSGFLIYVDSDTDWKRVGFPSDTNAVLLTGDQTIDGIKTFTSIPVLPNSDPTSDNEATRKAYVDTIRAKNNIEVVIENRTSDPSSPATGRIWLRTDL